MAAYTVAQRTHEIGVRIAVGASTTGVRGMLIRQGLLPVVLGLIAGTAGAAASGQLLRHLIDTAQPPGVSLLAVTAIALIGSALAALWKATGSILRLDPMTVLRAE